MLAVAGAGSEKREIHGKQAATIVLGSYAYGAFYGLTRATIQFVEAARYFNNFLRRHGTTGDWSTISLGCNLRSSLHRDPNNKPGTRLETSRAAGGPVSGEGGQSTYVTEGGEEIDERYHNVKEKIFKLNARDRHYVEEWEGECF